MSTIKQYSKKECRVILKNNGYYIIRTRGDHIIYSNGKKTISIPNGEPNKMLFRRLIKENALVIE